MTSLSSVDAKNDIMFPCTEHAPSVFKVVNCMLNNHLTSFTSPVCDSIRSIANPTLTRVQLEMPYLLTPLLLTVLVTVSNCYELKGFKQPVTNTACQCLSLQLEAICVVVIFDRKLVYIVIG